MDDRSPLSRNAHVKPLLSAFPPTVAPPCPASRLAFFALAAGLITLFCLRTLSPAARATLSTAQPRGPLHPVWPPPPAARYNPHPADKCHFFASAPDPAPAANIPLPHWRFNSRALCLASALCLRLSNASITHPIAAYLPSAQASAPECQLSTPRFEHALPWQGDRPAAACTAAHHDLVACAHGNGLQANRAQCPSVMPWQPANASPRWIEDLSILVPSYPYPANIFHYGNVLAMVAHVVDNLPRLLQDWGLGNVHAAGGTGLYFEGGNVKIQRVNILFEGPRNTNGWQKELLRVLWKYRLGKGGVEVQNVYLREWTDVQHVCMRNAVVLGRRGNVNVWFFPNATEVPLDGMAVPADAVEFKRAVYEDVGLTVRLPRPPENMLVELPPLVLGYARRLGPDAAKGGNVHLVGTKRRFRDEDEAWFVDMLRNETDAAGVRLHMFTTSPEETLAEQVQNIAAVGFVVGIHGANLVNAVFMQPFGALFEIFPGNAESPCYIAGSNSGLAYYRHTSTEEATPAETGCSVEDAVCQKKPRQRLVKIGREEDRIALRGYVKKGLTHLTSLHQEFPNGIPVMYDETTDYYHVDAAS